MAVRIISSVTMTGNGHAPAGASFARMCKCVQARECGWAMVVMRRGPSWRAAKVKGQSFQPAYLHSIDTDSLLSLTTMRLFPP